MFNQFGNGSVVKISLKCRRRKRCVFNLWVGKIPWSRKWQATPVFLPGKSHGQRSLAGYSPWDGKRVGHDLVTKKTIVTGLIHQTFAINHPVLLANAVG